MGTFAVCEVPVYFGSLQSQIDPGLSSKTESAASYTTSAMNWGYYIQELPLPHQSKWE